MRRVKCVVCGEWIEPEDEAWRVKDEAIHQECATIKEAIAELECAEMEVMLDCFDSEDYQRGIYAGLAAAENILRKKMKV